MLTSYISFPAHFNASTSPQVPIVRSRQINGWRYLAMGSCTLFCHSNSAFWLRVRWVLPFLVVSPVLSFDRSLEGAMTLLKNSCSLSLATQHPNRKCYYGDIRRKVGPKYASSDISDEIWKTWWDPRQCGRMTVLETRL